MHVLIKIKKSFFTTPLVLCTITLLLGACNDPKTNPEGGTGTGQTTGTGTGNNTGSDTGTATGTGVPLPPGGGGSGGAPVTYRGTALFEAAPNPEVIRQFREEAHIVHSGGNEFDLGAFRSVDAQDNTPLRNRHNQVPNTPVIHQYHFPAATVPLVVSFPPEFIHQLPIGIQNTLRTQNIDHLDLFFVPQHAVPGQTLPNLNNEVAPATLENEVMRLLRADRLGLRTRYHLEFAEGPDPMVISPTDFNLETTLSAPEVAALRQIARDTLLTDPAMQEGLAATRQRACLKPAFWIDPHMPYINTIAGSRWSHNVQMAIFEPNDLTIQDAVRIEQLQPFHTTPHDGRISDDVGHLNLTADHLYSFWALSVSPTLRNQGGAHTHLSSNPQQIKAAVSLHWLLPTPAYEQFLIHLQRSRTSAGLSLHQLVEALATDPLFNAPENRHMLDKLRQFLYPRAADPTPTDLPPQPTTTTVTTPAGVRAPVAVDLTSLDPNTVTPFLRFYAGTGQDHAGRTLSALWNFSAGPTGQLELTHDYIQWLFALPEPTGNNAGAPLLTDAEREIIHNNEGLRANIRTSLQVMSEFYHFTFTPRTDTHALTITPRPDFFTHRPHWLVAHHNYLRISRILRSLFLVGMNEERIAFMRALESVYASSTDYANRIGQRTLNTWRLRYNGDNTDFRNVPRDVPCPLPEGHPTIIAPTAE